MKLLIKVFIQQVLHKLGEYVGQSIVRDLAELPAEDVPDDEEFDTSPAQGAADERPYDQDDVYVSGEMVVLFAEEDGTPDMRFVPEYDQPFVGLSGGEKVCAHMLVLSLKQHGMQAEA